ncbi:dihydrodipicolinate synthetase [Plectosphaerella cucumerina]|uniref:Dihydrodipicolinate synthetase n=1 Tax=Plectosphaerella cucumerina TaxID=40658 RepID=A0A8K0TNG2_9PEZI|nr:dihydrodipicolinate synthetase [Plectosphaerella cucumerina]
MPLNSQTSSLPHAKMSPSALDAASGQAPASSSPTFTPGIYIPTVAFFRPDDSVDAETTKSHAIRLARSGVAGLVTMGSNGEAVHLDHAERRLITRSTRDALDAAGFSRLPVMVGCGAQSTRETIQLCRDAASSGGSHALVLPPAYYGGLLPTARILEHFRAVADASPIPVLIYNYPGACSGLDLDSDTITALADHPNIVGVKLTCGNTGKLARVVATTAGTNFLTFGGSVDFTLQTLVVGGHGIIGGTGNIAPRACVRLMKLWDEGKLKEARELQAIVAAADWAAIKGGFPSVKAGLNEYFGYGGEPRRPCAVLEGDALREQVRGFAALVDVEKSLEKQA